MANSKIMNRRQWLRNATVATGGIILSPYLKAASRLEKWLSPLPKLTKQASGIEKNKKVHTSGRRREDEIQL